VAKGKGSKEVATSRPSASVVEQSFGGAPPSIAVGGGTMQMFGHKIHSGVWPTNTVSPDHKTGYPKGFDQGTKGSKP